MVRTSWPGSCRSTWRGVLNVWSPPPPATFSAALDDSGGLILGGTIARSFESGGAQWLVQGGGGFPRPARRLDSERRLGDLRGPALLSADGIFASIATSSTRMRSSPSDIRVMGRLDVLTSSGFDVERGVPPEIHEADPRLWRYPDQKRVITAFSGGTGSKETGWGRGGLEASLGLDFGSFQIQQFDAPTYESVIEEEEGEDRTATLRVLGGAQHRGKGQTCDWRSRTETYPTLSDSPAPVSETFSSACGAWGPRWSGGSTISRVGRA